ncbi:uncharacterized protein LOC103833378 [Brassica rapa]|uniref:uncharacterized protein LOC103833378 n=1 Tax=Brassica campestris TaxID=3711 RepID=UPI0004F1B974|nr:uncharacterized protein LOC103833378 [Brassica rapa]
MATGDYSAKSGYKAQFELLLFEEAENPTISIDWSANVWDIKTSEKIKVFLWNALQDALPVGEQFAVRNIPLSIRCSRCNEEETVSHLLFTCPYSRKVWKLAPLATSIDVDRVKNTSAEMKIIRRIPSLPLVGLGPGTLTASICWNLWIVRNQLTFQKRDFSPEETLSKAIREAREWSLAQISPINPKLRPPSINQDPPPSTDVPCMYTDAAWNASIGCAGLGWIIDDTTSSSSSYSVTAIFVKSPLFAETLAMRRAMTSAIDKGITSLLILSDSQILIKLLNTRGRKLEIAGLLNHIYLLSNAFNAIQFKFIPTEYNDRADSVAKQALYIMS